MREQYDAFVSNLTWILRERAREAGNLSHGDKEFQDSYRDIQEKLMDLSRVLS